MSSDPLVASLRAAVAGAPDDVPLRLHLAELLMRAGNRDEAVQHAAAVLQREPANATAQPPRSRRPRARVSPAVRARSR